MTEKWLFNSKSNVKGREAIKLKKIQKKLGYVKSCWDIRRQIETSQLVVSYVRGLQAISVQFRFAFSKPSSCGARRSSPLLSLPKKLFFGQFAF